MLLKHVHDRTMQCYERIYKSHSEQKMANISPAQSRTNMQHALAQFRKPGDKGFVIPDSCSAHGTSIASEHDIHLWNRVTWIGLEKTLLYWLSSLLSIFHKLKTFTSLQSPNLCDQFLALEEKSAAMETKHPWHFDKWCVHKVQLPRCPNKCPWT